MSGAKVGAIPKLSADWSDTDAIVPGECIDKAIVSLPIQEGFEWWSDKYFYKKFESAKRLYRFKPRIFKGEAIQVLLRQKNWTVKAIVSFQNSEFLKMKRYNF